MARLDDMSIPIYVQARSMVRSEASLDEVWARLEEQAYRAGVHILLIDGEGNVIRQAPLGEELEQQFTELPSILPEPHHGTYKTPDGQTFIFAAYLFGKLFGTQRPSGVEALVLALPRSGALPIWANLVRPFIWAGIIAFGVSVVIAIFLARSVYHPFKRVTEAAGKIAQGQYGQEIPVAGPEEIKELAIGFNQMSRQVKLSQQRLRDFVADVSHQLKSPLTSIRGFAQAILDGTAGDYDTRLRAAQVIEDEFKRMIRQVDELLELSRMQSGQIQMAREPVDIKELLEHCRDIFAIRAEEKGVLLLKTDAVPLAPVIGDIDRLEQVFSNLLDNALKHSPLGGEVSITGRQTTAGAIEITVADSGLGIPSEQLPYVFERFYQVGEVRTGVGLGLAIAREIVLAHGGKIEAKSPPGQGAEFTVVLPTSTPNPSG